ncbi:hypothetical protein EAH89_28250 [Roseomonas nepalensis]|uniref:Colicin D immunity protein domain-containing protein n=1 Tax=Muricoccus nepalensis TaxID=1854500 RepID=A0A502F0I3_9PROT|nr:hypothetical protein [Roseomonas nepalensis]TPG41941.1 hypothetical protein EAH89_28250 [Roseomonas nepalensis]
MEAKAELESLIGAFLSGALSVRLFCLEYEKLFNFDVARAQLSQPQEAIFRALFDDVIVFSLFKDELAAIPIYRSEDQIRKAAQVAWQKLRDDISN